MSKNRFDWSKWDTREIPFDPKRGECHNCEHGEYWHLQEKPACSYRIDEAKAEWRGHTAELLVPREKASTIVCPCIHYIPGDNLAYLESLIDD